MEGKEFKLRQGHRSARRGTDDWTNFGLFLIEHVRRRHTGHMRVTRSPTGLLNSNWLLLLLLAEVSTFMVIMACQVDVVWSITVAEALCAVNQLRPR